MLFLSLLQFITVISAYQEILESQRYTTRNNNIYLEVGLYFLFSLITVSTIEYLSTKIDIDRLKIWFKNSVIIAAVLFISIIINDDIYFAVSRLFEKVDIFGTFIFLIFPTGVATGFELAIIKRKKEL